MVERSEVQIHSLRDYWEAILCSVIERPLMSRSVFAVLKYFLFQFLTLLMQIVLYVVSRVVASFIPRSSSPYSTSPASPANGGKPLPPDSRYFSLFAALSWGAVMWLFKNRGETIQPGMFSSMKYLYRDSETWTNLKTLLWHNT